MMSRAGELRRMLAGLSLVRILGVNDGFTARLGARAGFDALWASGLGICAAHGLPDAGLLGIAEFCAAARTMNRAGGMPIIADCDSGFGDVNVVQHMVVRYAEAGVAAVCIEDKQFPKRNSFRAGQQLADAHEFAMKIAAAKATASCNEMLIIARVEALVAGAGQEEAIERALLYASHGADAVLVHSKADTPAEVLEFASRWRHASSPVPLLVVPTTYPDVTVGDLGTAGVAGVIYANQVLRAAQRAVEHALDALHAHGTSSGIEHDLASLDDLFEVVDASGIEATDAWFQRSVADLRCGHDEIAASRVAAPRPVESAWMGTS